MIEWLNERISSSANSRYSMLLWWWVLSNGCFIWISSSSQSTMKCGSPSPARLRSSGSSSKNWEWSELEWPGYNLSFSPCRYRKVVSNNCTDGVREQYTAKPQKCPGKAPRGLRIVTADGKLTAEQGHNVTLMVQLEEVGPDLQPLHLLEPLIFSRQSYLLYVCFCFV